MLSQKGKGVIALRLSKGRRVVKRLLIVVGVLVLAALFFVYGIDQLTLMASGSRYPEKTYYVASERGLYDLDAMLRSVAKSDHLLISEGDFGSAGQPRELWRPGVSVMVMNEFACPPDEGVSKTTFSISVYRASFLGTESYLRKVERDLEAEVAQSGSLHFLSGRPDCLAAPTL